MIINSEIYFKKKKLLEVQIQGIGKEKKNLKKKSFHEKFNPRL